ncbi:hypothetical protein CI102_14772 [Trichoderma harzianum]|nr:hypothetical protein CI102_14772 [Trichoderma harzianum]
MFLSWDETCPVPLEISFKRGLLLLSLLFIPSFFHRDLNFKVYIEKSHTVYFTLLCHDVTCLGQFRYHLISNHSQGLSTRRKLTNNKGLRNRRFWCVCRYKFAATLCECYDPATIYGQL